MKPEEEIKKIVHQVEETAEKAIETTIETVKKVESSFVKWLKRLGKIKASILLLFISILGLLQLSIVQTYLARKATNYLTELTGFETSIQKVSIQWLDKAVLKNILIKDRLQNTMIEVDALEVNYSLLGLLQRKDIILDQVGLAGAKVNLINNAQDSSLNIQEWIDTAFGKGDPNDTTISDSKFIIREAYLQNTHFSYQDIRNDSLSKTEFDYFHFQLDSIDAEIENLVAKNDTIEIQINTLSAINPIIDFPIKELRTFFRFCHKSMSFQKLYAHVGNSILRDSLVFRYQDPADFADFNNKIFIHAKLKESRLTFDDLAYFAPDLRQWKEKLILSGNLNGTVSKLKIKKLDLKFGQNSRLQGDIAMSGLPNIEETFIDYDFDNSQINLPDLQRYLNPDQYSRVSKFGLVKFSSELQGFYYDFVTHGDFNTNLGRLEADNIHLSLGENTNTYEGDLVTQDFNLGELLLIPDIIQKIDLKGKIKGKGFTPSTAEVDLDAHIKKFGIYGYNYQHIDIDAKLSKSLFEGKLAVNDSNFIFNADADIDLKDSTIQLQGRIEKALLDQIGLATQPTSLKTNIVINVKGLDLDNLDGTANVNHLDLVLNGKRLDLDYFLLVDKLISKNRRRITLASTIMNFVADGDFNLGTSIGHLTSLIDEYLLHFERNSDKTLQYYAKKYGVDLTPPKKKNGANGKNGKNGNGTYVMPPFPNLQVSPYQIDYELSLKNLAPVFDFLQIDAKVAQNTKLSGLFKYGNESQITLKGNIDTLFYGNFETYFNRLNFNLSKNQDSTGVKGELNLFSRKEFILNEKNEMILDIDSLKVNAQLADFQLRYNVYAKQSETTNSVDVKGSVYFLQNQAYLIDIEPSQFNLVKELWQNPEGSEVLIQGREINFKNIILSNGQDYISINGDISEDAGKKLSVDIKNLDLNLFNEVVGFKLGGELSGFVHMQGLYDTEKLKIENELKIKDISIDNFLIGDIINTGVWDNSKKSMLINASIEREQRKTLICNGTYTPENKENPLDLKAELAEIEFRILEPFLADIASGFEGTASGELHITGSPAAPIVEGSAFIRRGKFKINYLGATYTFSDRVYLEKDRIAFKRFRIRDDQRNLGLLEGSIFHKGFQDFSLDLKGSFKNFKLLDTKPTDESLYYGTAIGSGKLGIWGVGSSLNIGVDVKSEKGTKMYLAFDGYSTVEQKDFINYVEFSPKRIKDTTLQFIKPSHPKINLSHLLIDLAVEITPEAYVEIILDRKTGDIIRGNARGKVSMEYDSKADFQMFGNVEIVQGAYNFTFQNLFNKEFGIAAGSVINWNGDPLKGTMNIKATYLQRASLAPILPLGNNSNESPEVKRRYPVQVDLILKGELFSPEIKFDINFFDYPNTIVAGGQSISLANNIAAFKTRIANDEAELNRQVFSLILLKRLSAPNAFEGLGQSAAGSVSELLTNQLSYWMSQVDENLEVDIDLNGLDANALNTFQLRLSYSFLNGRVRVTRDGSFTNMQNQANASSVIGDWTIEYLVTRDGKLRAKMYRRNFSNVFDATLGTTSATTGASIVYVKSFNKFWDFFGNIFSKRKNKKPRGNKKNPKEENKISERND
ncbi:MAG: translocation/assembly module TamB domain-containing protein [Thermoflexibacter sp.]